MSKDEDLNICDCGSKDTYNDPQRGEIICRNCGTVLEERVMENRQEWYEENGRLLPKTEERISYTKISDTNIDLNLTSLYNANETAALRVCGILSGYMWDYTYQYPGRVVVHNCNISVNGIEDDSNPVGDGAGIMVDGVCIRNAGVVELHGESKITTSRTVSSNAKQGYEYSLNNENGTFSVDFKNVDYDAELTNGIISDLE